MSYLQFSQCTDALAAAQRDADAAADEELARLRAVQLDDDDDEEEAYPPPDRADAGNATIPGAGNADPPSNITMEEIKLSQDFIDALKQATLADGGLPEHVLHRLREPMMENISLEDDPTLAFSLEYWLRLDNAADKMYDSCRILVKKYFNKDLLTLAQVKRRAEEITGVVPIYTDMCEHSCHAFTGPLSDRQTCHFCAEERYKQNRKGKRVPRKQAVTIPVGPQIQAAFRSRQSASEMKYRAQLTQKLLNEIGERTDVTLPSYADFIHSTQYINAVHEGLITDDTVMLMFSIDGAQLYRMKASDCWIYIWVVLDRAPDNRYKNKHIMIGGIVPGPRKPKNIESFLFPGFHHAAALMREGFRVWDAETGAVFDAKIFIPFFLGDGPGITILNGFVGHHGKYGCRLYCPMPGRHKPGAGGHYYPAMSCPHDVGEVHRPSLHGDINIDREDLYDADDAVLRYEANLSKVKRARTQAAYQKERMATGIVKPSLVSGFPSDSIFPIPTCFPGDIMHHAGLQTPDLFVSLWRGTIQCSPSDNKDTWDWAVFRDERLWKAHGEIVAASRPYLPTSYDRPPRNIAEKLTSGYKAVEFITYLYGLGPAILLGVLPLKYWKNICKMIQGVRLLCQHEKEGIPHADVERAQKLLHEFVIEFEDLYYQQKASRLHFCRQSLHAYIHLAVETINTGPPPITSQWPIERTIGILGGQIRQPSKPFANLAQRAVRRCQVNAIKHMYPEIDPDSSGPTSPPRPRNSRELGDGYTLLHFTDSRRVRLPPLQSSAIQDLVIQSNIAVHPDWFAAPDVRRWARLRLPNGNIARAWKEHEKPLDAVRYTQMIRVCTLLLSYNLSR